MTRKPIRQVVVGHLQQAMERRCISCDDLARRSGKHPKTVRRVLNGDTCDLATLELFEDVLRTNLLDCNCPESGQERPVSATNGQPIEGWKEASAVLRIPERSLRRHRQKLGNRRKRPWWPNEAALWFWYEQLVSGEPVTQ